MWPDDNSIRLRGAVLVIISHEHKFIFIKTRKTAGTSIEISLATICGDNDVITPINRADESNRKSIGGLGPQNYHLPYSCYQYDDWLRLAYRRKRKQFRNHNTASEVRSNIDSEVWDSYFKFCFERNPFDKVVSHFYWLGGPEKFGSFEEYVQGGHLGLIKGYDAYSIDGVVAVDSVYRFEDLSGAMENISAQLGLKETLSLPEQRAKSNTRDSSVHYEQVLSLEMKELVATAFAREISLMGYECLGSENG